MSFKVRDALFGFKTGKSVRVVQRGGRRSTRRCTRAAASRSSGCRVAPTTSRSTAPGLASARPIALSRDQELELTVVSYLDVAVVGGSLAVVAALLVILGRPTLRRRAFRHGPPAGPDPRGSAT